MNEGAPDGEPHALGERHRCFACGMSRHSPGARKSRSIAVTGLTMRERAVVARPMGRKEPLLVTRDERHGDRRTALLEDFDEGAACSASRFSPSTPPPSRASTKFWSPSATRHCPTRSSRLFARPDGYGGARVVRRRGARRTKSRGSSRRSSRFTLAKASLTTRHANAPASSAVSASIETIVGGGARAPRLQLLSRAARRRPIALLASRPRCPSRAQLRQNPRPSPQAVRQILGAVKRLRRRRRSQRPEILLDRHPSEEWPSGLRQRF